MRDIKYYLELPYTVVLRRDEEDDYVARVDELPGCSAHGKTQNDALENLQEAKELWIQDCIESGHPVPEPVVEEALPSGKWVQRVPRSLHKKLSALAKREGVSLNQLVTSMLAQAVGAEYTKGAREAELPSGIWDIDPAAFSPEKGHYDLSFAVSSALCTRMSYLAMFRHLGKTVVRSRSSQAGVKKHVHEEAYKI
jgi:antitoxin HicB